MAMAGRLMARLKRSRGVLPAASEVCSSGRSLTRPRLYRRSRRAGCEACTRADKMTAESTARPYPTRHTPVLMVGGAIDFYELGLMDCIWPFNGCSVYSLAVLFRACSLALSRWLACSLALL